MHPCCVGCRYILEAGVAAPLSIPLHSCHRFVTEVLVPVEKVAGWRMPSAADIATACSHDGVTINPDDIILSEAKIDFAMKARNPLNSVHFFDDHTSHTKYTLSDRDMTTMNLNSYQEVLLRVYTRNRDPQHVTALYRAVEKWQEKAFGGAFHCV